MATTLAHRPRLNTPTYLELSTESLSELITLDDDDREARYQAALELVERIDDDLTRGVRHYRTKGGALLGTLDEVIRAILSDDLLVPEAA